MIRRILIATLLLVPALVLALAGGLLWLTKAAEPRYSGELAVAGLAAPVQVRYGPHAVPSIAAGSVRDALFAQGFVVVGERMWQMDLMRRVGDGRLAEVFGPDALDVDRLFRTLGLGAAARRALADLPPAERALLQAHADGVNAYLRQAGWRLPIEYRIAGFRPEPWAPEDSLVIGAYMAWTQSFNLREELAFLRVAARIGKERARELFPLDQGLPAPAVAPELPDRLPLAVGQAAGRVASLIDRPGRFGLPVPGPASNAWLVTGRRTADGAALLANDPHLAPSIPGTWYELELIAPGLQVAGLVLPGVPLVLIGHNADIAWGFTSAIADTQDLVLERVLNPEAPPDQQRVERPGGAGAAIETRVQRIQVRGGAPVELAVRRTSHGVILNEVLASEPLGRVEDGDSGAIPTLDTPYLIALRQMDDRPDRGFPALLGLSTATSLEEARTRMLGFRLVSQNLMLAHRDGGIAWQVTGLLPSRARGSGAFPTPGWVSGYGWDGYVPQGRNPTRTDPLGAALITANNRTIPADYPVTVSNSWMAPYRAERIHERLAGAEALTPAAMESIQADRVSIQARLTRQALQRIAPELRAADPEAWAIVEGVLLPWDGVMDGASRAAALYALIEPALFRALYGDELGEDLAPLMSLAIIAYNPVQETIRSGQSGFWDDIRTPEREGPAAIWARALREARAELDQRLPEGDAQRLDRLQGLTFPHAFSTLPGIGALFELGPLGVGGGGDTVNLMKASVLAPERALFAPSARLVQTPGDWGQTRGTLPLGQSGHRLSPYRSDQLADWLAGRSHPWPWNGPAGGRAQSVLTLTPQGQNPLP
jgi:acyl-homoserine lactone acylase PvdQ